MRVVVALGGNALLRRGEALDAAVQRENVAVAADAVAAVAKEHDVVVTHGNGPQVGLLALQAAAYLDVAPYPLDVLGAESEGMIGYLIEQALGMRLPGREVATLLTQTVVDPADPAFGAPTKFVGPVYGEKEARRVAAAWGWVVAPDGDRWRRVVPSPEPQRILELGTIRLLVEHGVVVICGGGGGVPVVVEDGVVRGVEAVVDKDRSAALLARELGADVLALLTDVDAVYDRWPGGRALGEVTPAELRTLGLPDGSMGPKADAACRFVEETGGRAAIGALADAVAVVEGRAGTQVVSGDGRG